MTDCIYNARQAFPCGLVQPEGTFRCSVDALQIAAFAAMYQKNLRACIPEAEHSTCIADVGCGCGVVGLAMLLALQDDTVSCVGFEKHAGLVQAALNNAENLGFSTRYEAIEHDVRNSLPSCHVGAYDMVVCNPPWRVLGAGRLPAEQARIEALFADDACFLAFLTGVRDLARLGGWIFLAVGTERIADVRAFVKDSNLLIRGELDVYRPKGRGVRLHCVALQKISL